MIAPNDRPEDLAAALVRAGPDEARDLLERLREIALSDRSDAVDAAAVYLAYTIGDPDDLAGEGA